VLFHISNKKFVRLPCTFELPGNGKLQKSFTFSLPLPSNSTFAFRSVEVLSHVGLACLYPHTSLGKHPHMLSENCPFSKPRWAALGRQFKQTRTGNETVVHSVVSCSHGQSCRRPREVSGDVKFGAPLYITARLTARLKTSFEAEFSSFMLLPILRCYDRYGATWISTFMSYCA
jgi:hypothetical protein